MTAPSPIQPGVVVGGDFRIVAPLATGGMGALYVVEQLSTGKRRALKVMHPSLVQDPGMRERFVQEARVGGMVPSDHVVEVLAAGIDPSLGVPWLAMELLNGEDLAQHLARRGPLALGELPNILRPVCHALGAAHSRGIVHRDVKPENVFLATTMSSTQPAIVKVLDFGIAKVAAQAHGQSTAAMGTPTWMAPEQTELKSHVSPATDVWPLGLITFWLLTGKPYWRAAQDALGGSVPQVMREILFEPLVPPSQRARELGSQALLPPAFDAWFLRCVARDPNQRFPGAIEAANALFNEVLGIGQSVSVAPPPDPSAPSWPVHASPSLAAPTTGQPQPPQGATFAASATAVVAPPKKSALGAVLIALTLLFGLVLLLGGGGAYYYFFLLSDDQAPVRPATSSASGPSAEAEPAPEESAAPTDSSTGISAKGGASTQTKGSTGSAPATKTSATAASGASASAGPSKGPYDASAAHAAVNQRADWAASACKPDEGPPALSGTAVVTPGGGVKMVVLPPKDSFSSRAGCTRAIILSAKTKPYDGTETHSVPFAISF
jgi:eukaryotic-like serine/threonine-protein kinase